MEILERRPILIAIAGPNGTGKSTFYASHLHPAGLPFVNADVLARELEIGPYQAAELAAQIREKLVAQGESFAFETVFSDPEGEKVRFLKDAERCGYTVVLFFIGVDSPEISDDRVAMRILKGGHDVPREKLLNRYPRSLENLRRALVQLKNVRVYDNSDLARPQRLVATVEEGILKVFPPIPRWLSPLLPMR